MSEDTGTTAVFERAMAMLTEAKGNEIAAFRTMADQALAQLADAQEERDRERQRADKAEAQVADERVRGDQVRSQVDELRARMDELRNQLDAAEQGSARPRRPQRRCGRQNWPGRQGASWRGLAQLRGFARFNQLNH
jgi:uncharacterized coiled-coil DUF342 family protein